MNIVKSGGFGKNTKRGLDEIGLVYRRWSSKLLHIMNSQPHFSMTAPAWYIFYFSDS